jgi:hypothetical protein
MRSGGLSLAQLILPFPYCPHSRPWYVCFSDRSLHGVIQPCSQVEHEASVIGTKLIGTLAAIGAFLAYMIFRQWFANQLKLTNSGPSNTTRALTAAVSRAIDR